MLNSETFNENTISKLDKILTVQHLGVDKDDIVDDISWKSRKNYGILHGDERLRIYGREKFNHKTFKVKL